MNLIDFFDNCRFWGGKRNGLLQRIKFYGIINRLVDILANIILPIYFSLSKNNIAYAIPKSKVNSKFRVIISLTSFPKRLPTLHLVIESLLRQTVMPDKIILYLTQSQVPDMTVLPKKLTDLQKRGLEIILCPDEIRSHTKYFYAMQQYPDDVIITVDDDLFYRSDLVEVHLKNMEKYPNCVIANWVKEIIPGKGKYTEWPDKTGKLEKSKNYLILGVSSVLYPPHALHPDAFHVENIRNLSLTADDIWLTAMLLKQGTNIVFSGYTYNHLPVYIRNNETLISGNYVRNQICIDKINKYYQQKSEERPFVDIPIRNKELL